MKYETDEILEGAENAIAPRFKHIPYSEKVNLNIWKENQSKDLLISFQFYNQGNGIFESESRR